MSDNQIKSQPEPKKCGRDGCQPEIHEQLCCGSEFVVHCWCGKTSEIPVSSKEFAVQFWDEQVANNDN